MVLLMVVSYISIAIVFDGLVRMSENLGLDFFVTFTLAAATEIPSLVLLTFVLDRYLSISFETQKIFLAVIHTSYITHNKCFISDGVADFSCVDPLRSLVL